MYRREGWRSDIGRRGMMGKEDGGICKVSEARWAMHVGRRSRVREMYDEGGRWREAGESEAGVREAW